MREWLADIWLTLKQKHCDRFGHRVTVTCGIQWYYCTRCKRPLGE